MNNLLNIKTPAEAAAQARKADYNLSNHGISNLRLAYWNLPTEALYEEAIFRNEGAHAVERVEERPADSRVWDRPASPRPCRFSSGASARRELFVSAG